MANAVVTLILVALALAGVALIAQGTFKSADMLSDAWKQMEVRAGDIARTEITVLRTSGNTDQVDVTLQDSGQIPLRDFDSWDVIVEYYETDNTYHQVYLTYTTSDPPGNNKWTVVGIYLDALSSSPEVYQPGILDPEEEMVIRLKISPAASAMANNKITIGTLNAVAVSTIF